MGSGSVGVGGGFVSSFFFLFEAMRVVLVGSHMVS